MLDDLEERRLVVEIGLEVGGVNRDQPLRHGGNFVHRRPRLGERAQNGKGLCTVPRCRRRPHGFGCIARVSELSKGTGCIGFPGSIHELQPVSACFDTQAGGS